MSQLSIGSSSGTSIGEEIMYASPSRTRPVNISLGKAIIVVPLSTSFSANLGSMESQTTHTTSSEGPSVGNSSNPDLDKFREGSRHVDQVISHLVTRVLREDIPVAEITRPLAQIVPSTNVDERGQSPMTNSSKSNDTDNDLQKFVDSVLKSPRAQKERTLKTSFARGFDFSNQDVWCDEKIDSTVNVIDLSYDEELIKGLDSRIVKRLRSRKGKAVADTKSSNPNRRKDGFGPTKPWSQVTVSSRKRKIMTETESDDVEYDVQIIIRVKKIVSKQSAVKISDALMGNISFHSVDSADRWRFVYQRRITQDRELVQDALKIKEIMDLISVAGLMKTVHDFGKCYEVLVKEFVVNISVDCVVHGSQDFRKVYVRGKLVHLSPLVINRYLGRSEDEGCDLEVSDNQVCKEITANQVVSWPTRGKLSAGQLSVKYAILHRIGAVNWIPTNHTSVVVVGLGKFLYAVGTKTNFDYGTYIFYQTVRHASTNATKMLVAFPSLICGVVLNQHHGILLGTDVYCKRDSPLSLYEKLFAGKHVADLVLASAERRFPTTTDNILALKETCKDLDEIIATSTKRKIDIERLIKSLEQSDKSGASKATKEAADDAHESDNYVEGDTDDENVIYNDQESYHVELVEKASPEPSIKLELRIFTRERHDSHICLQHEHVMITDSDNL
ncbi:uncharacterized protein LOC131659155 [Vicia villosa]|uniref:uncharacterized protein LOC131659155 n=1 Tax=Vicia villosa TaxID=3911 RepID=UPI00273CCCD0|nr:uncharacterized protein LOC131659155 [Vicia villosa]